MKPNIRWSIIGKIGLIILGIVPYAGLTYGVVVLWDKYVGIPVMVGTTSLTNALDVFTNWVINCNARSWLECLAVIGSYALWYQFCKFLKVYFGDILL